MIDRDEEIIAINEFVENHVIYKDRSAFVAPSIQGARDVSVTDVILRPEPRRKMIWFIPKSKK